jgi:hypothetical protein
MTLPIATRVRKPRRTLIICLIAAAILVSLAATVAIHDGTTILLAPGQNHHTEVHVVARPGPVTSAHM